MRDEIVNADLTIPLTSPVPSFLVSPADEDLLPSTDDEAQPIRKNLKRKRADSDNEDASAPPPLPPPEHKSSPLLRHYAHVCAVDVNETLLENAELCGTNLAVKLIQMGADSILEEIHRKVTIIPTQ